MLCCRGAGAGAHDHGVGLLQLDQRHARVRVLLHRPRPLLQAALGHRRTEGRRQSATMQKRSSAESPFSSRRAGLRWGEPSGLPGPTAPLRPPPRSPGSPAQRRAPCPRLPRSRRRPPSAAAALRAPRTPLSVAPRGAACRCARVRRRTEVGERRIVLASGTLAHGLDVCVRLGSHLPVLVRHALAERQLCCQLQLLVVVSHAVARRCTLLSTSTAVSRSWKRRIIEGRRRYRGECLPVGRSNQGLCAGSEEHQQCCPACAQCLLSHPAPRHFRDHRLHACMPSFG